MTYQPFSNLTKIVFPLGECRTGASRGKSAQDSKIA
ncbi:hypothetical protein CBM2587_B90759 [Cupriavidus taiwanensis]|uniref:Uncharacterized protein n=1 Tax=Cupriavidus taiwanensis TaxID=164546 RepID=A0A975XF87_9BURK|nr:hypothetical protein CBM2587_B90759 [Cupriavidus taiwanensis]